MRLLFEGKVAIVTGGASGIGRAAAMRFAEEGASVLVVDRDEAGGAETVAAVTAARCTASFFHADLTRAADNESMVKTVLDRYGRLDAAFNNAGSTGPFKTVVDCTEDEWDALFDVNVKSVWLAMKYEIPAMLRTGGGAIVNTSSASAHRTQAGMAPYVASKHAVVGLSNSAATDFARQNIRVCALLPGVTYTPMMARGMAGTGIAEADWNRLVPLGRLGRAEEQADVAVWLCSDRASYVSGIALRADGAAGV
jgi:NAD(P)-dependent dehydrogenase (short-subunit alcohol dehydrogenase family)